MKQTKLKKVNLLELNHAYLGVLYWFFAYPTKEFSLNDLTKLVGISKTTANQVVSTLSKEGFLKVESLGKVWRIYCNQDHIFNYTRKVSYNLSLIYESRLIDEILTNIPNPRSIILFGSYRKGDDIETSDLDIAVETLDNENSKIIPFGEISQFGFRKNVSVNILKFSRNKIDLNLFSNLANGIVLYGYLEARP
ncbi:nucleotidyltransferase domain-containing protein [Candidatus Woesearchaeota archaeon]|nr:nucleotidyltransferase domain-containing protein [Candidatus Woesearchaeota archaeon]